MATRWSAKHFVEEPVRAVEHCYARRVTMRPEEQNRASRFENAMKLAEDRGYFVRKEMFEHSEIVDPVEAVRLKWKIRDIGVPDFECTGIVRAVEPQRGCRDIDGRDPEDVVHPFVGLTAARPSMQQMRPGFEISSQVASQPSPDDGYTVCRRYRVVETTACL